MPPGSSQPRGASAGVRSLQSWWPFRPGGTRSSRGALPAATFLQLRGPHRAALLLWHCTSPSFYPRGRGGLGTFWETQCPIPHQRAPGERTIASLLHASCPRQRGGGSVSSLVKPSVGRCTSAPQGNDTPHPPEWPSSQTSVGKDVEKGGPSCLAGGTADWKTACRCLKKLKITTQQCHV